MPALSIVIVNWNVRELLRACLTSVLEDLEGTELAVEREESNGRETAEIVVVDNDSADRSAEMVAADFPQVALIANERNVGFGAANNQGVAATTGTNVLFLNPDTVVRPGAFRALLSFLGDHPEVACVGPRLLNPDGSTQPSRRGFPHLRTAFVESTPLQRFAGGLPSLRRFYRQDAPDTEAQEVDWIVGAAMLIRRSVLEQVGGFDEAFFMYSEEMDLCFRIRKAGHQIWYVPAAEIVHHEGASSGQDVLRRNINFHEGRYRFFRKHHGLIGAQALKWFTFGSYLFQLAEEAGKLVLQPSKREMRAGRIKLYAKVVKWYLSAS